jgi:hypothetical protein
VRQQRERRQDVGGRLVTAGKYEHIAQPVATSGPRPCRG